MVFDMGIDDEIDELATSLTIKVKSGIVTDDWGNEYSSSTSKTSKAVPNDIIGDEQFVIDGNYQPGDKVFFFKSSESNLALGYTITFDSEDYRIQDIIKHNLQGEFQQKEVRCKKI